MQMDIDTTQGRKMEVSIDAEDMEKHFLPACTPWHSQPAFLYNTGPPVKVWHHHNVSSSLPHQSSTKKMSPQINLMEEYLSIEVPSS